MWCQQAEIFRVLAPNILLRLIHCTTYTSPSHSFLGRNGPVVSMEELHGKEIAPIKKWSSHKIVNGDTALVSKAMIYIKLRKNAKYIHTISGQQIYLLSFSRVED